MDIHTCCQQVLMYPLPKVQLRSDLDLYVQLLRLLISLVRVNSSDLGLFVASFVTSASIYGDDSIQVECYNQNLAYTVVIYRTSWPPSACFSQREQLGSTFQGPVITREPETVYAHKGLILQGVTWWCRSIPLKGMPMFSQAGKGGRERKERGGVARFGQGKCLVMLTQQWFSRI